MTYLKEIFVGAVIMFKVEIFSKLILVNAKGAYFPSVKINGAYFPSVKINRRINLCS